MARYRRKSVVVEAEQWFPGKPVAGVRELVCFVGHERERIVRAAKVGESESIARSGDWILTGVNGERWACEEETFPLYYEKEPDVVVSEESLADYLESHECKGFRPLPHYDRLADRVCCYFADEPCVEESVNEWLTLSRSAVTGEVVGCKIYGVKAMIADAESGPIELLRVGNFPIPEGAKRGDA